MPRGFVPQFAVMENRPRVRLNGNEERMLNSEIDDLEHHKRLMTEDGEWNEKQQEYYDKCMAEIKARLKELQKDKDKPILVHTKSIRKTTGRNHVVEFRRGTSVIDSFQEKTMESAASRFVQYLTEYERNLTMSLWDVRDGERFDLRGERMIDMIAPQNSRENIDRRSIRPKDDIVAEDGLVLNIDPDEKPVKEQPIQQETVVSTAREVFINNAVRRGLVPPDIGWDIRQNPDLPFFNELVDRLGDEDEF